jgi:hypothetical protein
VADLRKQVDMRTVLEWLVSLIFPPKGSRRAVAQPQETQQTEETMTLRVVKPRLSEPLYFVDDLPIVRPYLAAWEQQQRRHALLMATLGYDVDSHLVGAA